MTPFIKVCGIQNLIEAKGAIEAGANTLGFLVGITHLAEDKISTWDAREIIRRIASDARTVMVTHLLDEQEIFKIAEHIGVSAIQIHDDLPVERVQSLRMLMPHIELIKAAHVTGADALAKAQAYAGHVDMLLLDSRTQDRLGGTGQTHDWNLSAEITRVVNVPVILAGGLNPENVTEAIQKVKPAGIDANSGLENPDGSKNFIKIRAFADAGKSGLAAHF